MRSQLRTHHFVCKATTVFPHVHHFIYLHWISPAVYCLVTPSHKLAFFFTTLTIIISLYTPSWLVSQIIYEYTEQGCCRHRSLQSTAADLPPLQRWVALPAFWSLSSKQFSIRWPFLLAHSGLVSLSSFLEETDQKPSRNLSGFCQLDLPCVQALWCLQRFLKRFVKLDALPFQRTYCPT